MWQIGFAVVGKESLVRNTGNLSNETYAPSKCTRGHVPHRSGRSVMSPQACLIKKKVRLARGARR
jgi:hypothetical protein